MGNFLSQTRLVVVRRHLGIMHIYETREDAKPGKVPWVFVPSYSRYLPLRALRVPGMNPQ